MKHVRALIVSPDTAETEHWIEAALGVVSLNASVVPTIGFAVSHLAEEVTDVVVASGVFEDGTLHELLHELAVRGYEIPVIVVGDLSQAMLLDALSLGAFDYVRPGDLDRLGTTMIRAVREAELTRSLRSARDELHAILTASDQRAFVLDHVPALIWTTDADLVVRTVDGGGPRGEGAVGRPVGDWDVYSHEEDRYIVLNAHRQALAGIGVTVRALWNGVPRYISVEPLRDDRDRVIGTIAGGIDLSSSAPEERRSMDSFTHDVLTDLPHRAIFEQRVAAAAAQAERDDRFAAVLFVDIDRFKTVNDLGGHAAGDAVLRAIAHRIRATINEGDAVARFSGDEFVVLCCDLTSSNRAHEIAVAIIAALQAPFTYGEDEFHLTASVGISVAPDDAEEALSLIANAETALFEAKRLGRNTASFFVPTVFATPSERHALKRDLANAIERGQLDVSYQPMYNIETHEITGLEALLRWNHPSLGMIAPDRFIPMAEETGLIDAIGDWVIARVCEQIRKWTDSGIVRVHVSVNVSARQFEQLHLQKYIASMIAQSGIKATSLEIEVTESSIMRDMNAAIELLTNLKAMGLRVAIDDFGTGYTSLSFLKRLPIDVLKIDRTFVQDVATENFDGAVVRAVTTLARSLGVQTIAEGVEEMDQVEKLRDLNCDIVQGFLFSEPLNVEDCTTLLLEDQNTSNG